jgi:hypothetical protein
MGIPAPARTLLHSADNEHCAPVIVVDDRFRASSSATRIPSASTSTADFAAELESHVALHTEDGIRSGLTPRKPAARRSSVLAARSKPARRIANAAHFRGLRSAAGRALTASA